MARARRGILLLFCVLGGLPGIASAHEIAGRFEAPIPLGLLFAGAGVTVALTAVFLTFTDERLVQTSRETHLRTFPSGVARPLRYVSRGVFFVAFGLAIVFGFVGRQVPAENFAIAFVWAVWLKGIAIFSAVFGSPWRVLSPWQAVYDGLTRLEGDAIALLEEYPDRLGEWPAVAGFLLWVGILQDLTVVPRSPQQTALFLLLYTTVMLGGGLLYGYEWFQRADALSVLYRLFGRVSPVKMSETEDGAHEVLLRFPWDDCTSPVRDVSTGVFIVATVFTVSFDGFTSTPAYQTLFFALRDAFGTRGGLPIVLYLGGFTGFVSIFTVVTVLAERAAGHTPGEWTDAVLVFVPTVIPIAVAYETAHNYPFVVTAIGQLIGILLSTVLGGPIPEIDILAWLSLSAYWWSQVLLIVVGHLVAVFAAHTVAITRYPTATTARRAHGLLVILMVGYTVLSLWIISRPIVSG